MEEIVCPSRIIIGHLIVDKHKKPVVFLSAKCTVSLLPEVYDAHDANLTSFAILLVADPLSPQNNQYCPVFLKLSAPLPTLAERYSKDGHEIKSHWYTIVEPFFAAYREELGSFFYTQEEKPADDRSSSRVSYGRRFDGTKKELLETIGARLSEFAFSPRASLV